MSNKKFLAAIAAASGFCLLTATYFISKKSDHYEIPSLAVEESVGNESSKSASTTISERGDFEIQKTALVESIEKEPPKEVGEYKKARDKLKSFVSDRPNLNDLEQLVLDLGDKVVFSNEIRRKENNLVGDFYIPNTEIKGRFEWDPQYCRVSIDFPKDFSPSDVYKSPSLQFLMWDNGTGECEDVQGGILFSYDPETAITLGLGKHFFGGEYRIEDGQMEFYPTFLRIGRLPDGGISYSHDSHVLWRNEEGNILPFAHYASLGESSIRDVGNLGPYNRWAKKILDHVGRY